MSTQQRASAKFKRQYKRSRDLVSQINGDNYKAVLNTLYHVYPVAFERPEIQERIRRMFGPFRSDISVFDINMARLFRRSEGLKLALCCMPKSGSTFLLTSLKRLDALAFEFAYLQTPYMNMDFVDALSCEHEIDELSLLIHEMRGKNWVSQMHTKWTPYTEQIFRSHGIRPIITYRNIFDCVVSMDDMFMRGEVAGFSMIRLPRDYRGMVEPARLAFLCDYAGPWYVDYVVSWSRINMPCLRLSYEADIIGFGEETAHKIHDFIGDAGLQFDTLLEAFEIKDDKAKTSARFNKGVVGRGHAIPEEARERLTTLARLYEKEVDFSMLL